MQIFTKKPPRFLKTAPFSNGRRVGLEERKFGSTSKVGAKAVLKIIKSIIISSPQTYFGGLLMPMGMILTNNATSR